MRVKLRNDWFAPDHRLFKRGEYGPDAALGDFPDVLAKHLPSSATKLDKLSEPVADEAPVDPRAEAAAEGDALNKFEEDAAARLRRNQARIQAKLAAEK